MALMNAGNEMEAVGRGFDALELYEAAVRVAPDDAMARGNRGMTFALIVPALAGTAHQHLVARAISDLQFALSGSHLDGNAEQTFRYHLHRLEHHIGDVAPEPHDAPYEDPYVEWVVTSDLSLSLALGLRLEESGIDPAHLTRLVTAPEDFSMDRPVPPELEAVNAIKRDYLSTRFIAYLALVDPDEARLAARSRSAFYVDTLDYARWDLESGLLGLAYASAVNLADKIATFLSLWLRLGRDRVNDRNWAFEWVRRDKKSKQPKAGPVVAALDKLMREHGPRLRALLGLIDIAQEEAEAPSEQRRPVRDAAVHRFLSVRWFGPGASTQFADAIGHHDLAEALLAELRRVRRMYFQICWAVAEKSFVDAAGKPVGDLPLWSYQSGDDLLAEVEESRLLDPEAE